LPQKIPNIQDRIPIGGKLQHYIYPFTLKEPHKNDTKTIDYINNEVRDCKKYIPPYAASGYKGLRGQNTRAVDYEDFFFNVFPATIIPLLVCDDVRAALTALHLASFIAMQWYITNDQLEVMEMLVHII
jgi:hypothetical protein